MVLVSHAPDSLSQRVWYFTVEWFVHVPHDNRGVLIGQSGGQCKLHIGSHYRASEVIPLILGVFNQKNREEGETE